MKSVLERLGRSVLISLGLGCSLLRLAMGGKEGCPFLQVGSQDWPVLWRKTYQAGGAGRLSLRVQNLQEWDLWRRLHLKLVMRRMSRLQAQLDLRCQIVQQAELATHTSQSGGYWRAALRLWLEQVAIPAAQWLDARDKALVPRFVDRQADPCAERIVPNARRVAIVGWYGTETLGDCAILGEILACLTERGILAQHIAVYGTEPDRTRITLLELDRPTVASLSLYQLLAEPEAQQATELFVFGGGPLCDGRPMAEVAFLLEQAAKQKKQVFLWGVGIGPLRDNLFVEAVRRMIRSSDRMVFRDHRSLQLAHDLAMISDLKLVSVLPDPAAGFLLRDRTLSSAAVPCQESHVRPYCLFAGRPLPRLTLAALSTASFLKIRRQFDQRLISWFQALVAQGIQVRLISHESWPEEDRDYFANLLNLIPDCAGIEIIEPTLTIDQAIDWYRKATAVAAVRFHAAVFAVALNKPFLAVDYTWGGGKTMAFLQEVGLQERGLELPSFLEASADQLASRLLNTPIQWEDVNKRQREGLQQYGPFFLPSGGLN